MTQSDDRLPGGAGGADSGREEMMHSDVIIKPKGYVYEQLEQPGIFWLRMSHQKSGQGIRGIADLFVRHEETPQM